MNDTPHRAKTAGELAQAYEARLIEQHTAPLRELIHELLAHLDYCGWGDRWERDFSEDLRTRARAWKKANPLPAKVSS